MHTEIVKEAGSEKTDTVPSPGAVRGRDKERNPADSAHASTTSEDQEGGMAQARDGCTEESAAAEERTRRNQGLPGRQDTGTLGANFVPTAGCCTLGV